MERERTILPIFVRRSASGNKFPPESRSSVIVLNFMALNIRAFFPGRSWVKKTPAPLLVKWRKIIRRSNMGQITAKTKKATIKSIVRFKKQEYSITFVNQFINIFHFEHLHSLSISLQDFLLQYNSNEYFL